MEDIKTRGGIVIIVPHYSSRIAWGDITHKMAFSSCLFEPFTEKYNILFPTDVRFKVEKIKLRWSPPPKAGLATETTLKLGPLIKFFNSLFSFLANLNVDICERLWCYWVGGFGEIRFEVKVIK